MNSFEELYNSTLKICPIKEGEYSLHKGLNEQEEEKQGGGFIDLNIPVSAQPKQNYTDYNKIDPVAIYRNKMSLKNTACSGFFSSDRTIEEYIDDIWFKEGAK